MRMKPEHFDILADKVSEDLSPRARLIVMRRVLRHVLACDRSERIEIKQMIRQLKTRLPFAKSKLVEIKELLGECRRCNWDLLADFGGQIRALAKTLEQAMSFDELCDVLCVNPVRRAEAKTTRDGSLFGLLWTGGNFEDSAHRDSKSGRYTPGPVTWAVETALNDFMIHNSHLFPDPLAPGGPLYGVPTYTQQPDGSMVMNTPAVTVHSAAGSKVVGSKPRRAGKPVTPSKVATLFADTENVSRHEGG